MVRCRIGKRVEVYQPEVAMGLIEAYVRRSALEDKFFVCGHFDTKTYLGVRQEEDGEDVISSREPQLIYSGEINPLNASRSIVEEFLNGLGSILAHALKQTRVHYTLSLDYEGWDMGQKLIPPSTEEEKKDSKKK